MLKQMKGFYDVHSKIIHGVSLKPKHLLLFENRNELREILRRLVISIIAIRAEGLNDNELNELMDQMLVDEEKRSWVQQSASKLLHIHTSTVQ